MNKIQKPAAIFWDWDGTLSDSYSFLNDAHNHTLTTLGFPQFKEGEYAQYFGKPRDFLYPAIYKERADEALHVFGEYVHANSHKIPLLDGAKEALDLLHSKGIPMGIVSNKKAEFIRLEVKNLGLEHHFKIIIGSGEAEMDKPSGAPLELALERTGLSDRKEHVWFVGDTENDLLCAKNAGCPALFLTGHPESQELLKKYAPLLNYKNYKEFIEFLVAF